MAFEIINLLTYTTPYSISDECLLNQWTVCNWFTAAEVHADTAPVPITQQSTGQGGCVCRRTKRAWLSIRLPVRNAIKK